LADEPVGSPVRRPRLIVTRPAAEADAWVQALSARGWPALSWPLIDIGPPRDSAVLAALREARSTWTGFDALMFVSAAAVHHFFFEGVAPAPGDAAVRTRFWCPGPGTARALSEALMREGLDASRIDTPPSDARQFDSEHLWPVVEHQVFMGFRLLVVRGHSTDSDTGKQAAASGSGREWLMERCREKGAQVSALAAYGRLAPEWGPGQKALAMQATGPDHLWLFSSSEAVSHLLSLLPGTDWTLARALCTHERIARTARDAGFGRVLTSRPDLDDVLRTLESAQETS
jgi:uroporphyrinogen-III synthase